MAVSFRECSNTPPEISEEWMDITKKMDGSLFWKGDKPALQDGKFVSIYLENIGKYFFFGNGEAVLGVFSWWKFSLATAVFQVCWFLGDECTPPKFNIEHENDGVQEESPFPGAHFQVPC